MKDKIHNKIYLNTLLIIIGILYILFLYIDIFNIQFPIQSYILKYLSIICCFIIVLIIGENSLNKRDISLLQAGLLITIFADLSFLIFHYYNFGVIFFCLIQMIYYIRYTGYRDSVSIFTFIAIFLIIIITYIILKLFIKEIDFLYVISFFYSICLIATIVEAIKVFKTKLYPSPNKHMILIGMILFLLGDINVAMSYISKEISVSLGNNFSLLIWVFYLPSQALLSLSGYKYK